MHSLPFNDALPLPFQNLRNLPHHATRIIASVKGTRFTSETRSATVTCEFSVAGNAGTHKAVHKATTIETKQHQLPSTPSPQTGLRRQSFSPSRCQDTSHGQATFLGHSFQTVVEESFPGAQVITAPPCIPFYLTHH